jgi:hypothetical protein
MNHSVRDPYGKDSSMQPWTGSITHAQSFIYARGTMRLSIAVNNDLDGEELASLYRWLAEDPEIARNTKLTLGSEQDRPGFMGPDAATISAMISAGTSVISALSALLTVVLTWQGTRPRGTAEVAITPDDGAVPVILTGDSAEQSADELSAQIIEGVNQASDNE